MNGRHLTWLALSLAVVAGAVALISNDNRPSTDGGVSGPVLPGLSERVNQANELTITVAGDIVAARLVRDGDRWQIEQLDGYPADWNKVRAALAGLAEATVVEPKTGNPDYYARLGVEDVDDHDAAGALLSVRFPEGEPVGVIVGNEPAGRSNGRYLRVLGATASVLSDFDADVPREPLGWADTQVVDLAADNVAEVRITQPDGALLRVWKGSADDTDFVLDGGLPEGRELQSIWAMNSVGSALANVRFDAVRAVDEVDWADSTRVEVLTFTGVQVVAELTGDDESGHWLKLSAEAPYDTVDEAGDTARETDAGDAMVETATEHAARINRRTAGWAYRITDTKAAAMDKQLEDLLKPLEAADTTAAPAD